MFRKVGAFVKNAAHLGGNRGDGEEDAISASAVKVELEGDPSGSSSPDRDRSVKWDDDDEGVGSPGGAGAVQSGAHTPRGGSDYGGSVGSPRSPSGAAKRKKKGTKRKLITPRKSTVKKSVYEPPNLQVALKRMRSIQPHEKLEEDQVGADGKRTRKLRLRLGQEEMMHTFSDGIVFWFVLLRDWLVAFVGLIIASSVFFNLCRRANEANGTGWDRLNGLPRATWGAVLFWSHDSARSGSDLSDTEKDDALAVVFLDAIQMLALLGLTVYHFYYKNKIQEEVDNSTITMEDYSIEVHGLPLDATEESVRAHFEQLCGPVHEVTFGRDLREVMQLRRKQIALESSHELLEWMLRRAQKLLGTVDKDEPLTPQKLRMMWQRAYEKVKKNLVAEGVLEESVDLWGQALAAARDESRSMKERTAAAAKAAQNMIKKGTVGVAGSKNADDFNPDIIKAKMKQNIVEREDIADAIAACAQEGFEIVCAWVAFENEQHCVDCIKLVNESKRAEQENIAKGLLKNAALARISERAGDIRAFRISPTDQAWKLYIKTAAPPSDVLWENLHYREKTMWKRKLRSLAIMIFFLVINVAAIAGAMAALKSLKPSASCAEASVGDENLNCPLIWDLDSSSLANTTARDDIKPFISGKLKVSDCSAHIEFGEFIGDMSAYAGFYTSSNAAAFRAAHSVGTMWDGGFDTSSNVDECAAHVCYNCYCGEMVGYSANILRLFDNSDKDGLGSFCKAYRDDQINKALVMAAAVLVSMTMNLILKELCNQLAWYEHSHSLTQRELSIASYLVVSLVINMALLPLFVMANISELRDLPWLFEGDHKDVGGPWYGEFSKKFMEIAFLNAVSFPFTLLSPVVLWKLQVWFFTNKVKSQRELNELMTPPPFLLSERYGQLIAQVMYSLIFSAGMPLVYVAMVLFLVLSLAIDRVMLLRYCANPPRYTGKLSAMLLHLMPVCVVLHFGLATWIYGHRDSPSYVLGAGVTGSYPEGTRVEDGQWDVGARIARANGLVPFVCMIVIASFVLITEVTLAVRKKLNMESMEAEGCPPLSQALAQKVLTDLPSYSITANPEYKHLFPEGDEVTENL